MKSLSTDVLIIGSGIAGLTAALTCAEAGQRVIVATKKSALEGSSRYAQGGIAAVQDLKWDSYAEHIRDTLVAGCNVNNRKAVEFLVRQAPQGVAWLRQLGVRFHAEPTREAAHSHSRIWHTGDSTGASIERALVRAVRRNKYIQLLSNTEALDILKAGSQAIGALVRGGTKIYSVYAGATILATGGFGGLYARTTNPAVSVGDGLALAYRAGAKLRDLEFVQFHPTALVGNTSRLTLLSESLRGEGAVLRNGRGERFMPIHHPAAELAPRDIVARAIFAEASKGPVYLDFTRADPAWLRSRFPFIWREVQKAGFNLSRDQIPVQPVAHYACGGIVTGLYGETNIKNLFAIGEVARTGLHGANRLASNSLAEAVVWGMSAGKIAAKNNHHSVIPTAVSAANVTEGSLHFGRDDKTQYVFDTVEDKKIISLVRKTMWEQVGIVRTTAGLTAALKLLNSLHPKSVRAINAVTVARLVTIAAIKRKKSLGTHYVQ